MSDNFDLSEYVLNLISTHNNNNESVRNAICDDIETVKNELTNKLLSLGCDQKLLSQTFQNLIALTNDIKLIETEINKCCESDFRKEVNKLIDICNQRNESIKRTQHLNDLIDKLKQIRVHIESVDESYKNKLYDTSVKHLKNATIILRVLSEINLNDFPNDLSEDISHLLMSLKTDIIIKREDLINNFKMLFNSNINICSDDSEKQNIFVFNFVSSMQLNEYQSLIHGLTSIEYIDNLLQNLIKSINMFFVRPILDQQISSIELTNDNKIIAKFGKSEPKLSSLKLFIKYFSELITFNDKLQPSYQLLNRFGNLWKTDLFNQILTIYLNGLLPQKESELTSYMHFVNEAEDIRKFMIENNFISDENGSPFIEFSSNINSRFASRLCKDYILRAKSLICNDLHQTVEVGNINCNEMDSDINLEQFACCRVSQFMLDLIKLIKEINSVSEKCSQECASTLNDTIYSICELYIDISPIYYKRMITEYPQQNAIFHNNCIYFSYFIESIKFKHYLPNESLITDLVPILRKLGSLLFMKQMKLQEQIMLNFFQTPQLFQFFNDISNCEFLPSEDNKSNQLRLILNQCLVHLRFLKNTLRDVLPEKLYYKALGTVVNSLFNEIINRILSLSDISSSGAEYFSKQINYLTEEMKQFFDNKNLSEIALKWLKLNELNFILNANLVEIVERWSAGNGILALHFTAEEVKHLIRALFQNTERRSVAISKIKFY